METENKDLVYCYECKQFKDDDWGDARCRAEFEILHDHKRTWRKYAKPAAKNAENDCKDFEMSFWTSVKATFKDLRGAFDERAD